MGTITLKEHVNDGQKSTLAEVPKLTVFRFADGDTLFGEMQSDNPAIFIAVDIPKEHGEKNGREIAPVDGKGGVLLRYGQREVITYPSAKIVFHAQGLKKKRLRDNPVGAIIRLVPANGSMLITSEELKMLETNVACMIVGEAKDRCVLVRVLSQDADVPSAGKLDDDIMVISYNMEVIIPMQVG